MGYLLLNRLAASCDNNRIRKLLEANAISAEGEEGDATCSKGNESARARLVAHKAKVIRLAERLVRDGSVDHATFLRLVEE